MNQKIFALPINQQLTPFISLRQLDELPIIVIIHPKVRAAISLQGAHLLAWQPNDEQPIIWLSKSSPFKKGIAIRGGIPICWPWFGPVNTPSHGFARNQPWLLTAHTEAEQGVSLTFTLKDNEQTRQLWPHDFELHTHFKLGDECEVTLESLGDYQITAALHTYFNVGDIRRIHVAGLGKHFIDKVAKGVEAYQLGELVFDGQTDRIYTQAASCNLIDDPVMQRTIEVHHHRMTDVIAWNPGPELSVQMPDMSNDGYQTMVCIETGHVTKTLNVSKEQPAHLAVTIRSLKHNK